jgi:hypothetical protein
METNQTNQTETTSEPSITQVSTPAPNAGTGVLDTQTQPEQRPDWLPEKFKSPQDLAKSYQELSTKLGDMYGAPEEYAFEGEELSGVNLFKQVAKEQNISQKGFEKIVTSYLEKEKAVMAAIEEQTKNDIKEIGSTRIDQVKNQLNGLGLSEEELKTINGLVKSKSEFNVIEKFLNKINANVTTTTANGVGNNSIRAQIDAIRHHPNFAKNINNYRSENHQALLELYAQERR